MKIKGIVFSTIAIITGYGMAMDAPKRAVKTNNTQTFQPLSLTQQALTAKAKNLVPKIHSAQNPQQAIDAYRKFKTSDLRTLPVELHKPLLAELGRQYYISYAQELNTGVPWGVSIQDYLTSPALKKRLKQQLILIEGELLLMGNKLHKLTSLKGLELIPDKEKITELAIEDLQLKTLKNNSFSALPNLETFSIQNTKGGKKYSSPLSRIEPNAFASNILKTIDISSSELEVISNDTFSKQNVPKLEYVIINTPKLKYVGENAFEEQTNLTLVILRKVIPNLQDISFLSNVKVLKLFGSTPPNSNLYFEIKKIKARFPNLKIP